MASATMYLAIFAGPCGVTGSKLAGHCGDTLSNSRPLAKSVWRQEAINLYLIAVKLAPKRQWSSNRPKKEPLVPISVAVLAGKSLRSPQKIFIRIIKKHIYRIKVYNNNNNNKIPQQKINKQSPVITSSVRILRVKDSAEVHLIRGEAILRDRV